MKTVNIHSLKQTEEFAARLADLIDSKTITISLSGDLGAGKTTFTKALGKALGVKRTINSPTFTIMKSYHYPHGTLHHIDAYRLEGISQDLGFEECFEEGICVVEWADFISDQLPADHLDIAITGTLDEDRVFTIRSNGPVSENLERELA